MIVLGFFESETAAAPAREALARWCDRRASSAALTEIQTLGRTLIGAGSDQFRCLATGDKIALTARVDAGRFALAIEVHALGDAAYVAQAVRMCGGAPYLAAVIAAEGAVAPSAA